MNGGVYFAKPYVFSLLQAATFNSNLLFGHAIQ
jgi:hypothetical protein